MTDIKLESKEEVTAPEVVEIPWEEVRAIFEGQIEANKINRHLGNFLVDVEKRKLEILSTIEDIRSKMMQQAIRLQEEKKMDPTLTYELKMPTQPGESGFFVKK